MDERIVDKQKQRIQQQNRKQQQLICLEIIYNTILYAKY